MKHTPEEIKYRLSDLGIQIGNIAIEYITDLEKENAELKADNAELKSIADFQQSGNMSRYFELKRQGEQLTEAKEIIKDMLRDIPNRMWYTDDVIKRAEDFIKE